MKKLLNRLFLLLLIVAPLFSGQYQVSGQCKTDLLSNGTVYSITLTNAAYLFDSARYSLFIPHGLTHIRGVLVHQHGCTMEGRGVSTVYDVQYQAFAKKWGLAVVGPDLYSEKGNCLNWINPESGSAEALIKALEETGKASGHPELGDAPWLLWGHSGGGYWTLAMLRDYPERTIAVFAYSPAFDPTWDYPEKAYQVPLMIRHAGIEGDALADCWATAIHTFGKLRKGGGYASIAYTPYQNHNYSFVRYMAIPFYEAALAQRLPERGATVLREMDTSKAWLGDTLMINTYKASGYKGNTAALCWLPDSTTAAKWKEYVITGTVADRTPPPPPYDLHRTVKNNWTVELTWKADADIESGIKQFKIFKGGHLIALFPASGDYQRFDTNGDDAFPVTTLPELKLELTGIAVDDEKLSICTVNHFLLESVSVQF